MASITIGALPNQPLTSLNITGNEKIVTIGPNGKPMVVSVNQILSKVDDTIADRVEDQVLTSIDNQIEDRVEQVIENASSTEKEDIDTIFNF